VLDEIIERDGAHCAWCGAARWRRDLTIEHVLPRSAGGVTTPDNALVACRRCNRARGSRPVVAYVRSLRAQGIEPVVPAIRRALERLSASGRRRHRAYGERQLELLRRVAE
jgi:5-methylcytosine-specific restriction endonuclease McrA